jgi:predicted nucleic acid-binding Zn ribbon protein
MPVYLYEYILPDGSSGPEFEWIQSMKDDAFTKHPESGKKVRRLITSPNIASKYTPGQTKNKLENKNVEKAGFTKYERDKLTGQYHRVAGKGGPETIKRPSL